VLEAVVHMPQMLLLLQPCRNWSPLLQDCRHSTESTGKQGHCVRRGPAWCALARLTGTGQPCARQ
jgi:hypothetical protein